MNPKHEYSRDRRKSGPATTARAPRVRQIDVAERAGVHVSTVSLALRNSPEISGAMRLRICTLALEMGYVPDPAVQRFVLRREIAKKRKGGREILGYVAGDRDFGEIPNEASFPAIKATAENLGYRIERFSFPKSRTAQEAFWRTLKYRGIRGVVIDNTACDILETLQQEAAAFCAVGFGGPTEEALFDLVLHDRRGSLQEVLAQLSARGIKRTCLINGEIQGSGSRQKSWADYFDECRRPFGISRETAAEESILRWLGERERSRTTGSVDRLRSLLQRARVEVLILTDAGAARALEGEGIHHQQAVSIVGLGEGFPASVSSSSLQPGKLGCVAVKLLDHQLRSGAYGFREYARKILVPGTWHAGETLRTRAQLQPH